MSGTSTARENELALALLRLCAALRAYTLGLAPDEESAWRIVDKRRLEALQLLDARQRDTT